MNSFYAASSENFFQDVKQGRFQQLMIENASRQNINVGEAEQRSYKASGQKIKELLKAGRIKDVYLVFELMVPYSGCRIDCMIFGCDSEDGKNVMHIELKQWSEDGIFPASSAGNFVEAYTGGKIQTAAHPSQQVKGYHGYLKAFVEAVSTDSLNLQGCAYCFNYIRKDDDGVLFNPKFDVLQEEFRTYAANEKDELAGLLHTLFSHGSGEAVFNEFCFSPLYPSVNLLENISDILTLNDKLSLVGKQIEARNDILAYLRNSDRYGKNVVIVNGGPGTGKTVIALKVLAELSAKGRYRVMFATKSKPLLEAIKCMVGRQEANLLFHNLNDFIPARCMENGVDVLLVDEAHRIELSPNNKYTKKDHWTELSQIETLIRAARSCVFFIDDRQAIRHSEIGKTGLITSCAQTNHCKIENIVLESQFRCNGSDNYLNWLEDVLYPRTASCSFSAEEYDFRIFDDPAELYRAIREKNSEPGMKGKKAL
ncbi:DNA/RNA helicase domain-containing protein [Parabacteroides goldsteinii]|uniref:DNA/RNA helicase domain-containing protein n=1 Tax=Parabacteroides goldsteinii TaxID=328812 RepID=UPI0025580DC5|nr:DNA/RNA helicase domain-containing protein [Parabacteroides goldsteinii]